MEGQKDIALKAKDLTALRKDQEGQWDGGAGGTCRTKM